MAKKITKGALEAQDTKPETTITPDATVLTETPAKKKREAKATTPATIEVAAEPPTEVAPKVKRTKTPKSGATLADVFKGYVESLESDGKSTGTIASYRSELVIAGDDLGIDTRIADITPERVLLFFGSDRVQRKRSGKAKSPLSVAKTIRVCRQALQWAETNQLVATAPLPELSATH